MPKISVIVPIYKTEKYLKRCVDSILMQSFTDLECILVDDGSPDNCGAICEEYVELDKRVKVIHQKNKGLSGARNAGLDIACGEYISFVDSDDMLLEGFYDTLYRFAVLDNSEIVVFTHNFNVKAEQLEERDNSRLIVDSDQVLSEFYDKYYNLIWPTVMPKLYRKEIFERLRFREGIIYEDTYIFPDIILQSKQITILPYALYSYTLSDNSIMRSSFTNKRFHKILCWQHYIDFFIKNQFKDQVEKYIIVYLYEVLKMYSIVESEHRELLDDFSIYLNTFKAYKTILRKYGVFSKRQKIIVEIFPLLPRLSLKVASKLLQLD